MQNPNPNTSPNRRVPRALLGAGMAAMALGAGGAFMHESGDQAAHEQVVDHPGSEYPTLLTIPVTTTETPKTTTTSAETPIVPQSIPETTTSTSTAPETTTTTTTTTTTLPAAEPKPVDSPSKKPESAEPIKPKQPEITEEEPSFSEPIPYPLPDLSRMPVVPDYNPNTSSERTPMTESQVTPEISQIMRKETVYIPTLGCSGMLIRNPEGIPIGFSTAEHCGLRDSLNPRYPGSDGQTYMVMPGGVEAMRGDNISQLIPTGTVSSFILNPVGDTTKDGAYGVFAGHTPEEVMANDARMTPQEIATLKKGDAVYMSGWPVDQDNNHDSMRRQEFATNFLGHETVVMTTGEVLNVVWTAAKSTVDGAECSFGASGASGFILKDGKAVRIGDLAAFNDLVGDTWNTPKDAQAVKQRYENVYGVDLTGYSAICGFVYQPPTETVRVVRSANEIPGYNGNPLQPDIDTGIETPPFNWQYFDAVNRESFLNSENQRTVVDGVLHMQIQNTKGGPDTPDFYDLWVDRPVVFYDIKTDNAQIGMYDENMPDNLRLLSIDDISTLEIYDRDTTEGMPILTSTGLVTPFVGEQPGSGGFHDAQDLTFSQVMPTFDPSGKQLYALSVDQDDMIQAVAVQ